MDGATDESGFDDESAETGVWRFARASRVRVIIDAADYFDLMQRAMLQARRRVMLIGWDVDTRIHLTRGRRWWERPFRQKYPSRLGSFIPWLVRKRPELEVRILKWGLSLFQFMARGSMVLDLARWAPNSRIDFKFDTAHPIGCSHHQKIAVIDEALAVCGGIDMTDRRWDTREHRARDRRRRQPNGRPYGPWHDLTMMMEGDIAQTLGQLGRDRWKRAGGRRLAPIEAADESPWPEGLEAHFTDVEIGIARTRAAYDHCPAVNEIEALFLQHIARAKRFIYAENQYFASRAIAEAIAARLVEDDPPEIVIVHAESADGWIEAAAMDPMRAQLLRAIQEIDRHDRFHLYVPYSDATPIYVHAKLLIVDDEVLRVGSANFNNRSMGLDSECDVFIDCARPANHGCGDTIRQLRHSLLAEHCGLEEDEVGPLLEKAGSMAGMIASLGAERTRTLRPFHAEEPEGLEAELAEREVLDPEAPEEMFRMRAPERGLFRPGSLLARAKNRLKRKRRRR